MVTEDINIRSGDWLSLHQCRHDLFGIDGGAGQILIGNSTGGTKHKSIGAAIEQPDSCGVYLQKFGQTSDHQIHDLLRVVDHADETGDFLEYFQKVAFFMSVFSVHKYL